MTKIVNNKISAYPLSSAQRRIWFLSQLDSGALSYNIGLLININEDLDITLMQSVLNDLVERHEVLRTIFISTVDNEPVQVIKQSLENKINFFDISQEFDRNKKRKQILKENSDFEFNISLDSLVRVCVIKKTSKTYDFFVIMHHIISDIWSLTIFGNEFFHLYNQKKGEQLSNKFIFEKLKIQYKDYAVWENSKEHSMQIAMQEKYWLHEFKGDLPILELPTDRLRPNFQTYETKNEILKIGSMLSRKVFQVCQEQNVTPFVFLFATYHLLLYKLSNQKDLIIGTYSANRDLPELENVIGVFLNNLAIRVQINPEENFINLLESLKEKVLSAMENKDYPFEQLIEKLNPLRDLSRAPIFSTVFQMFSDDDRLKINFFGRAGKRNFVFDNGMSQFDLTMKVIIDEKRLNLILSYNTFLFKKDTIKKFLFYYQEILEQVTAKPDKKVAKFEILPLALQKKLTVDFNDTYQKLPNNKNVSDLFFDQALRTPKSPALVFNNQRYLYDELAEEVKRAASWLEYNGVKKDTVAGIRLPRSENLIIFLLAILKVGATYVPINIQEPKLRWHFYLNDSKATFCLSDKTLPLPEGCRLLRLSEFKKFNIQSSSLTKKSEIAYVVYTSGSTGQPKGVKITHQALINFIYGIKKALSLEAKQKILASTNISFDIFFLESLVALCLGLEVVLTADGDNIDTAKIKNLIIDNSISIIQLTPSHLSVLIDDSNDFLWLKKVKKILIGGEALPSQILIKLNKIFSGKIYNLYGPTETTIWSSVADLSKTRRVSIGKPLVNTQIYILNQDNQFCPPGVIGEIFIAGAGLASGYTSEVQTKKFFLTHPIDSSKKIYRTGDFGYISADGELFYSGRSDRQVKISGRRLELGEIESRLSRFLGINQVVVLARVFFGEDKRLLAYYTGHQEIKPSILKKYLLRYFPEYLVPDFFVYLKVFPLNNSGKIDREKLPLPNEVDYKRQDYQAPTNEFEVMIIEIWRKVLQQEKISRHDNFFQIGGHSLALIKVFNKLENKIPGKLNIAQLFVYSTPTTLAEYIQGISLSEKVSPINYRRKANELIGKVSRGEITATVAAKIFAKL